MHQMRTLLWMGMILQMRTTFDTTIAHGTPGLKLVCEQFRAN